MRSLLFKVFFSIIFLSSLPAMAQDVPVPTDSEQPRALPYEVVVRPNVTRGSLRELIVQVEEDFYEKFNELNIDDKYDIACYKHTPTMSHISERVCEPWFMIRARGDNASDTTYLLGGAGPINKSKRSAFLLPPEAMRKEMNREYEVLEEKMEELTRTDSTFQEIGSVLAKLRHRLKNFGKKD